MSKDPAILFYTGDFLNGCLDLTFEERGQYITLLCLQHQKGHLSEKTIRLSLGSVSVDVLKKFTKDEEGNFFNERMDEEIEKRAQYIDSRRDNGSKGGRPKKAYAKPYGKAKENHSEDDNRNENDIINQLKVQFEIFRTEYPGTKRGTEIEFENLKKKHNDWKEVIPFLSDALTYQKSAREIKHHAGGFVPEWKNLSTWINQRCWEEEIETNNISNGAVKKHNGATTDEIIRAVSKHFPIEGVPAE